MIRYNYYFMIKFQLVGGIQLYMSLIKRIAPNRD